MGIIQPWPGLIEGYRQVQREQGHYEQEQADEEQPRHGRLKLKV